jgi:ligand-binding SRPBCC domain-containing protein
MTEFTLHRELWLPRRRDDLFPFFADARNLEAITPPWLGFRMLTPAPVVMRSGTLIDYALRLRGLPLRWQSEITAWDAPHCFVDEQRRGPYRRWIHEHRFEEHTGGTLCVDHVCYAVLGGRLAEWLFVRRDLEHIFAYRRNKLLELFSETNQAEPCPR